MLFRSGVPLQNTPLDFDFWGVARIGENMLASWKYHDRPFRLSLISPGRVVEQHALSIPATQATVTGLRFIQDGGKLKIEFSDGRKLFLQPENLFARVGSADLPDIEAMLAAIPSARMRGEFIKLARQNSIQYDLDWSNIRLGNLLNVRVICNNPFETDTEKVAELVRDRKSTRLNSSHSQQSRMPSSA